MCIRDSYEGQTLYVYNWGEYTGENIIQDFEEKTGAKVVMENFDSNEQMYIKVANGEAYDILVPSDYMIQRLIQEDYLQKLDHDKLDCMDKLADAVKGCLLYTSSPAASSSVLRSPEPWSTSRRCFFWTNPLPRWT